MSGDDGPSRRTEDQPPDPRAGPIAAARWFFHTDNETVTFVREVLSSAAIVAVIGLLLFGISGVWPPMVAVESGSMTPHMQKGDLIFLMEEHRFPPDAAHAGTGVVTYRAGQDAGYRKFGDYGDVIIFTNPGRTRPSIIHRARFWVDEGENWYREADDEYVTADSCAELRNCPAPHAGFITKGDNNPYYDQARGISEPVKPEWIRGTAEVRVPWLGWVRLLFSTVATDGPAPGGTSPLAPAVDSGAEIDAPSGPPEPTAESVRPSVVEARLDERLDVADVAQPGVGH